jgi:hypothetical protein
MNLLRKRKIELLGIETVYSLYEQEVINFIDNILNEIKPRESPYYYDKKSTIYYNDNNGNTILIYHIRDKSVGTTFDFWNPINDIEDKYFKEENEYYKKILIYEGDIAMDGINPNHFVRKYSIEDYLIYMFNKYKEKLVVVKH